MESKAFITVSLEAGEGDLERWVSKNAAITRAELSHASWSGTYGDRSRLSLLFITIIIIQNRHYYL